MMGGFLTGQTNVSTGKVTELEKKEQTDCVGGVKKLKSSFENVNAQDEKDFDEKTVQKKE